MKPRLLMVEDDPLQRKIYSLLCERFGFECKFARNYKEVRELLQRMPQSFDVITLDWGLGEESGLDCIAGIRAMTRNWNRYVPVICITAHALTGDREVCITAGADDYLSKPFSLLQFESTVKRWLVFACESMVPCLQVTSA